jgi:hypothetical protein
MEISNVSGIEQLSELSDPYYNFWMTWQGYLSMTALVVLGLILFALGLFVAQMRKRQKIQDADPESQKTLIQHRILNSEVRGWRSLGESGWYSDSGVWSYLIPALRQELESPSCSNRETLAQLYNCRSAHQLKAVVKRNPSIQVYVNELVGWAYRKANPNSK